MFGRGKTQETQAEPEDRLQREGAKNRPTPKRRDQEAARKRPLVASDRKEAKRLDRQKRREQMARTRKALETGDEAYLPTRDKGPRRRYVRDAIDSRRNLAEFLLPIMLIVLALSIVPDPTIFTVSVALTWTAVAVVVVDTALLWRRIKAGLQERFDGSERGDFGYMALRTFQMRRQRMPKPQVARGDTPR